MSVRAWFTISALVLIGLGAAFGFRFFAPVPAPEIVARVGSIRLTGQRAGDCWPQRDGKLRCRRHDTNWTPATRLRGKGTIHIGIAYPARPEGGTLTLTTRDGRTVTKTTWKETLRYQVAPGQYAFRAFAEYPAGARVAYFFPVTVTTSGS